MALLLVAAFVPLAAVIGARLYPALRPPKHRPLAFVLGGLLAISLGALSTFAVLSEMGSGVFSVSTRYSGLLHADSTQRPLEYWAFVLLFYGMGVLLCGFGLASIGLCFNRLKGSEP